MCRSAKGNQVLWVALPVTEHNKDFRVGDLIHHAIIGVSWIIWILCWRREETLLALCILTNQDSTIIHVPQTTRVGEWIAWPSWVRGIYCKIYAISVHGCWKVKESFKIRLLQGSKPGSLVHACLIDYRVIESSRPTGVKWWQWPSLVEKSYDESREYVNQIYLKNKQTNKNKKKLNNFLCLTVASFSCKNMRMGNIMNKARL